MARQPRPNGVYVQFGQSRSGSTWQFVLLCAAACLRQGEKQTNCWFLKKSHEAPRLKLKPGTVVKVHTLERFKEVLANNGGAKVFVSASRASFHSNATDLRRDVQTRWGARVDHVQLFEELGRRGHSLVADYDGHLDLSAASLASLAAFMRYWEILRRCCGAQMSSDYRNRLVRRGPGFNEGTHNSSMFLHPKYIRRRSVDDPEFDACEAFDLQIVEELYRQTEVFRRCHTTLPVLSRLSDLDAKLDGAYCARAQRLTVRDHLHFNDKRYADLVPLSPEARRAFNRRYRHAGLPLDDDDDDHDGSFRR